MSLFGLPDGLMGGARKVETFYQTSSPTSHSTNRTTSYLSYWNKYQSTSSVTAKPVSGYVGTTSGSWNSTSSGTYAYRYEDTAGNKGGHILVRTIKNIEYSGYRGTQLDTFKYILSASQVGSDLQGTSWSIPCGNISVGSPFVNSQTGSGGGVTLYYKFYAVTLTGGKMFSVGSYWQIPTYGVLQVFSDITADQNTYYSTVIGQTSVVTNKGTGYTTNYSTASTTSHFTWA